MYSLERSRVATIAVRAVLVVALMQHSATAMAYQFWPSEIEWAWWPDYCKARYVDGDLVGAATKFRQQVSAADVAAARARIGVDVYTFVHHHCAGLIWLQRARLMPAGGERSFALNSARYESTFTLMRIPQNSPIHAEILVHLGMVQRADSDPEGALDFFRQAVEQHPHFSGGYQGISLVLRQRKDLRGTIEILRQGSEATNRESAELEYYLGLAYVEAGEPENALVHAERAYKLGFPLPALRDRLERLGYTIAQ